MKNFKFWLASMLALVLTACGGGGGDDSLTGGPPTGGGGTATVTTLQLIQNTNQLRSASDLPVEIIAIASDENGGAVEGAAVTFSSGGDSGSFIAPSSLITTDSSGRAAIELTTTNPVNRSITISASAGSASDTVQIDVVGTTVEITGPTSIGLNDTGSFTVFLSDSNRSALAGRDVTISSANGNTITAATTTTDTAGKLTFDLTIDVTGDDVITVDSTGATASANIAVLGDAFSITSPAAGAEIPLGNSATFAMSWQQDGNPVAGAPVVFSTTRGVLEGGPQIAETVVTDGSGLASVNLSSLDFGVSDLTITDPGSGVTASIEVEFVATVADSITVEAELSNVVTEQSTTVTATVKDPNDNPVKNQVIVFGVQDITGGSISPGSAVTDSNGVARTFYTAGPTTSNNVTITGTVIDSNGNPTISDADVITVAGQEFRFDIGTGNSITNINDETYGKAWIILVTDGNSNPVANSTIQVSAPPLNYRKGNYVLAQSQWVRVETAKCAAEDANYNGQIDPGEDINMNGSLEPSNVVSLVPIPAAAPISSGCDAITGTGGQSTTVQTNDQGLARICAIYAEDKANWVEVDLTATAGVSGSESSESVNWLLSISADDINNSSASPPGNPSPYGESAVCTDDL